MNRHRYAGWALLGVLALSVTGCASGTTPTIQVAAGPTASLAPSCPTTLPATNTFPAAAGSAVVPGAPTIAAVCRYAGLNDAHPNTIARSATVTGAELDQLVSGLNAARPFPPGARNCPADLGLYDLIVFGYPAAGPVDVRISMSGCTAVTNGHQTLSPDSGALDEVTALVGESPRPVG
jgi:hypothetical protein